jgi:hypothetical protein
MMFTYAIDRLNLDIVNDITDGRIKVTLTAAGHKYRLGSHLTF